MLTKELLRFRARNGRAIPEFIAVGSALESALAKDLIESGRHAIGLSYGEARSGLADLVHAGVKSAAGLAKLVADRLVTEDPDPEVASKRWDLLIQAEGIRRNAATRDEFESTVAKGHQSAFAEIAGSLYADLPDARLIKGFEPIEPDALICRYNTALVQGLLIRAENVQIRLPKSAVGECRRVFRAMRFHRLIPAVQVGGDQLVIDLGGPLSLFGAANIYGTCISNFIPHVFTCETWEIEAPVMVKNKRLILKLNQDSGLVSHYRQSGSWIPEEFTAFASSFASRFSEWQVDSGSEPLMLGHGTWCLPDFSFKSPEGRTIHLELFHRWHSGALEARVKNLAEHPRSDLILGVCRQLSQYEALAKDAQNLEVFSKYTLRFTDFPTPVAVMALLKKTLNS